MARPGIEPRTSDLRVRCPTDCATRAGLIDRSTTVCLPVWKIIHLLKLVDYFFVQADKPWYNYYILLHLFSLMLGAPVAEGEIFSTVKRVLLNTAFHYHPPIVLIWLKYCWKGRKITTRPVACRRQEDQWSWSSPVPIHPQHSRVNSSEVNCIVQFTFECVWDLMIFLLSATVYFDAELPKYKSHYSRDNVNVGHLSTLEQVPPRRNLQHSHISNPSENLCLSWYSRFE